MSEEIPTTPVEIDNFEARVTRLENDHEALADRVTQVEIDVREAKGLALEGRSMAMQARDRALLAFAHAPTDPALPVVVPDEPIPEEPDVPEPPPAPDEGEPEPAPEPVVEDGSVTLDAATYADLVATLQGVRDAMDLAVGAMSRRQQA